MFLKGALSPFAWLLGGAAFLWALLLWVTPVSGPRIDIIWDASVGQAVRSRWEAQRHLTDANLLTGTRWGYILTKLPMRICPS